MNRLWIGIGILLVLFAMGIGMLWGSRVFFEKISDGLEQAGELALAGNWTAATAKVQKCRTQWEAYRRFWAAFTDHEPVEEMQTLFSQLELYSQRQLDVDFAVTCRHLCQLAEAINESHSLCWWSVL